jgi:hypothetical protein
MLSYQTAWNGHEGNDNNRTVMTLLDKCVAVSK